MCLFHFSTCFEQPSAHHQENQLYQYIIWYISIWKYVNSLKLQKVCVTNRRSQWPRGLRRRFSAAHLLRLWVRIPPRAWMFVCCECCVLSGRGLCDGLITRPEESYRLWRVVVCDKETSKMRKLKPATGLWKIQPQWVVTAGKQTNKHVLKT